MQSRARSTLEQKGTIMTATPHLHLATTAELARVLHSAVILSWDDLMPPGATGSIHVEYGTGVSGAIDFLKVFSSTTWGYWKLACEYWVSSSWGHTPGMSFGDFPCPRKFAQTVQKLMQHAGEFTPPCEPSCNGVIQVTPPSEAERKDASNCLTEVFDHLGDPPAQWEIVA
jgi:hypothetical protein